MSQPRVVEGAHVGEGQRLCGTTLNRIWWHPLTMSVLFGGWEADKTWEWGEGPELGEHMRAQLQS